MAKAVDQDQKALIKKHGIKIMNEFLEKRNQKKLNTKCDFRIGFIPCDCESEILVVRYDGEFDMLDLCIYETKTSFSNKMTLWQKFRYAYQVFKNGQPYTDQIILNREQIEQLKGFIANI